MPINQAGIIFYSSQELARILKVTQNETIEFISAKNFPETKIKGERYIEKDQLPFFFDEFFSYRDMSPKYYEIPEELNQSAFPWAVTLVKIYQEKFAFPACLSPDQGQFLRNLVCNLKPENVLEIGCFIGASTIWLASGLEQTASNATVHSVDLFNDIMPWPPHLCGYLANPFEFAQKSVASAQLSHQVKFYKMNSRTVGEKFNQIIGKPIDFLFIDGDHSPYGCLNDFVLFYPHVQVGGTIILHDIYPKNCGYKGPRYVIDRFVKRSPHFDLTEIETTPRNYGIALIRKLGEDKRLYSEASYELKMRSVMPKLKQAIWPRIKDKPLGNVVRKILKH